MSRRDDHDARPDEVMDELARALGASDMTGRVLGRLKARGPWARWRTWLVVGGFAVVMIGAGAFVQKVLAPRREPTGPTVPSAIRQSLDRYEDQFDRAGRTIRQFSPGFVPLGPGPEPQAGEEETPGEEADPLASGHA